MKKKSALIAVMMLGAACFALPAFAESTPDLSEEVAKDEDKERDEEEKIESVWALAYMEKEEDEEPTPVKDNDSWLVFRKASEETKEPEFILILSGEEMLKGTWSVYEDVEDAYVLTPEKEQEDAVAGMFCPAGKLYEEDMFVIDVSDYFLFFTKALDKDPEEFLNRLDEKKQAPDEAEDMIVSVEEAVEDTYAGI